MARLAEGARVNTEFGPGTVEQSSARRVFIQLDAGGSINVATGSFGYERLTLLGDEEA